MSKEYSPKDFEQYIAMIKDASLRDRTFSALKEAPGYYWTLQASTSGKYHGYESLCDHVSNCMMLLEQVKRQLSMFWSDDDKDVITAALLLHDIYRCGEPGAENKDAKGNFHTHPEHGQICANILDRKWGFARDPKVDTVLQCIRYHYGAWGPNPGYVLSLPFHHVVVQTHNIDAMEAWGSRVHTTRASSSA